MELRFIIFLTCGVLCIAWEAYAAVDCSKTGEGRFAITEDTSCRNYTACIYMTSSKSYVAHNYTCPLNSVFNPNITKCTAPTNYVCNMKTPVCTKEGYAADPSSTDCTSFITCVLIDGSYIQATETCPETTFFNPKTENCEFDYTCSYKCSAGGRFANSTDITCKTYFMCVLGRNGTYIQYGYRCPSISLFNPNSKLCTTTYSCT